MNEDYFYKFYYKYKDQEVTMQFNADVTMEELARHLQDFLKACSWRQETVEEYIKIEED